MKTEKKPNIFENAVPKELPKSWESASRNFAQSKGCTDEEAITSQLVVVAGLHQKVTDVIYRISRNFSGITDQKIRDTFGVTLEIPLPDASHNPHTQLTAHETALLELERKLQALMGKSASETTEEKQRRVGQTREKQNAIAKLKKEIASLDQKIAASQKRSRRAGKKQGAIDALRISALEQLEVLERDTDADAHSEDWNNKIMEEITSIAQDTATKLAIGLKDAITIDAANTEERVRVAMADEIALRNQVEANGEKKPVFQSIGSSPSGKPSGQMMNASKKSKKKVKRKPKKPRHNIPTYQPSTNECTYQALFCNPETRDLRLWIKVHPELAMPVRNFLQTQLPQSSHSRCPDITGEFDFLCKRIHKEYHLLSADKRSRLVSDISQDIGLEYDGEAVDNIAIRASQILKGNPLNGALKSMLTDYLHRGLRELTIGSSYTSLACYSNPNEQENEKLRDLKNIFDELKFLHRDTHKLCRRPMLRDLASKISDYLKLSVVLSQDVDKFSYVPDFQIHSEATKIRGVIDSCHEIDTCCEINGFCGYEEIIKKLCRAIIANFRIQKRDDFTNLDFYFEDIEANDIKEKIGLVFSSAIRLVEYIMETHPLDREGVIRKIENIVEGNSN